jgi:hypothetical protein
VSPFKPQQAFTQVELIDYVDDALAGASEIDGVIARDVVDWVIDLVISALRADPGIPDRTRLHWETFFADLSNHASDDLHDLNGLIQPREAIWAIKEFFIDHGTDDNPSAPQARAGA